LNYKTVGQPINIIKNKSLLELELIMQIVTIDELGRISLPTQIREQLKLKNNKQLSLQIEGDRLILKPIHNDAEVEYENGILVVTSPLTNDLEKIIEAERNQRIEQLTSW